MSPLGLPQEINTGAGEMAQWDHPDDIRIPGTLMVKGENRLLQIVL